MGQYSGQLTDHYGLYQFISSGFNWDVYIFVCSQLGENIHHFLGVGGCSMFTSTIVLFSGFCWTRQLTSHVKQIYFWDFGFVGEIKGYHALIFKTPFLRREVGFYI